MTGLGAMFPYVMPGSAIGKSGIVAPSNRIVMGAIGVGSMGRGDLNGFLHNKEVQVVAVCDVDASHSAKAKEMVDGRYNNSDCKEYMDYRDLLAQHSGDMDAVMHALPDHWHGIISVACARAGLDIHGQKPMARTIKEGRAICDAVKRYGCIWQTGSWQRSVAYFHKAAEMVNAGVIGKVKYVEVGLPNGSGSEVMPVKPVPERLNYDMWLGPAPWREHVPLRGDTIHWNWRWIMDYSGGQLTDWAGHHIDIAHWGLGFDKTGPVSITEAKGVYPTEGTYDVPTAYRFKNTYANGVEIVVANAAQQPHGMGTCWYGEDGQWIHVKRGGMKASSPEILNTELGPNDNRLYKSVNHHQNFIDCIKSRKETITPAETAHRSISAGLLGEIAMLTGRDLKWDPVKETFIGDDEANRYLSRPYRAPWTM